MAEQMLGKAPLRVREVGLSVTPMQIVDFITVFSTIRERLAAIRANFSVHGVAALYAVQLAGFCAFS